MKEKLSNYKKQKKRKFILNCDLSDNNVVNQFFFFSCKLKYITYFTSHCAGVFISGLSFSLYDGQNIVGFLILFRLFIYIDIGASEYVIFLNEFINSLY